MALGVTQSLPVDERHVHSKDFLEAQLAVFMGGRIAELLVFNQIDTGAGNDLERATKLARKMVCNWGMSDKLGPVTFGRTEEHIFLGRELQRNQDYSESTAVVIDEEIRSFIEHAEETARRILSGDIEKLHSLAKALLEKEIMDSVEVDAIINPKSGNSAPVESPLPAPSQ